MLTNLFHLYYDNNCTAYEISHRAFAFGPQF